MNDTSMTRKTDPKYDDDLVNKRYVDKNISDNYKTMVNQLNEVKNEIAEIIESGSNANGNYIKYADGTMICYKTYSGSTTISTAWGSLYEQVVDMGTLPNVFIGIPTIIASPGDGAGILLEQTGSNTSTTSWGRITVVRPVSGTVSIKINLMAIGRWK